MKSAALRGMGLRPRDIRLHCASMAVVVLSMGVLACTPERVQYLEKSVNTATQDDVLKRLGPPTSSKQENDGTSVWVYRYENGPEYSYGRSVTRPDCQEILTFDKQKILRTWTRQDCRD